MQGEIRLRQATVPEASTGRMAEAIRRLLEASCLLGLPETEEQLRLALLTLWAESARSPLH